ncbi:sigma E protease regulator RseP [Aestuariirhabdus sp. Z084]|uniref:sigma E protease regulator RseP n=1 Tax=Aestuariirhabdus haliotis TaxID=2918751 RepID=UPI00201B3785|nr:sigma E protease regulator RseP [Aestuariirhabdus haliotis]MCL6416378.1 sigma E protease regulator RseP [Aestuariirhabdus haliotis]MCL6420367.1 sigma E protease regulator RseP [Aestuariirhabdus haliotis]
MDLLQTILATIVTLGILVTFHEFGHYWVAKRCGVKVLRFSVGFGKPLWRRFDRHGTEFVIAAIPLGGYVKMLDEREAEVPESERHLSFNSKTVGQRIAIVAAGPLANFLLAIAAFWLMFVIGVRTVVPVIGDVEPDSVAEVAGLQVGDELVSVDGDVVRSWDEALLALLGHIGESGEIQLGVKPDALSGTDYSPAQRSLMVDKWLAGVEQPDPLSSLGITPYRPEVPAVIGVLLDGGRAGAAGLQVGDRVIAADDRLVNNWFDWVELVRAKPEQAMRIEIERAGQLQVLELIPARKVQSDGTVIGYIGAGVEAVEWPESLRRTISYGVFGAVMPAVEKTWSVSVLTLDSIRKMIMGLVSVKNLSGPITIAKVAGESAKSGIESFLNFLAILSISLGVLNLLPVPVLDGGHLLFYIVEWIKGSPVPEKVQAFGFQVGIGLIGMLMMLALYNDFARL